tara:strand:- start:281 stop:724 length:444 start_codon:yes stop_codon:yes gene_type:complete
LFKQLLILAVLIFTPSLSFAQLSDHTFETSIQEGQIYIIVQIEIRDSNENLVGYIETDRITVQNLESLSIILDDMSKNSENTKIMNIDDKKYQVITGVGNANYVSDTTVSLSAITDDGQTIVYANYDGFPIRTGDIVITTWTMIRLV